MPTDVSPIPREELPPGWGLADSSEREFVYSKRQPTIELRAKLTVADRSHPSLGLSRCWELQCRHSIGELVVSEPIGYVSTRQSAIRGLLECMHCVHQQVDRPDDPLEVQDALTSVELADTVPSVSFRNR